MLNQEDDFIYYQVEKKKFYGFIIRDDAQTEEGSRITVRNSEDPELHHLIEESDIISNYGMQPNLDDLKLNVHCGSKVVSTFGSVTYLKPLLTAEENCLEKVFNKTEDTIKKFDIFPLRTYIKYNKSARRLGAFKYNKKEDINELTLSPEVFDEDNLKGIIYKYCGLGVWNKLPVKIQAAWIKLYNKNIERRNLLASEVNQIREDLIASGMQVGEYIKTMEDGNILKKILKFIKNIYNLKPQHIDILIGQGNDLKDYWPQDTFELSDYNAFVSQEATLSVEDFFTESIMFYYMKFDLPQTVSNALEKTLTAIGVMEDCTQ